MSDINYLSINENFPVAGQDNDTQTFRDNFDTIKNSLRSAKDEITDLQDNTARLDQDNDFNRKIITRAVMQNNYDKKADLGVFLGTQTLISIDFENGPYQIFRAGGGDKNVEFLNFPNDSSSPTGYGKITLEIYGDGGTIVNAGSFLPSQSYQIVNEGSTSWTSIGAANNTAGTIFTASGVGSGNGTARVVRKIDFITSGGTVIKKSANFPNPLIVSSQELAGGAGDPIIIEVWQHKTDRIFINYLGQFSS